MKSKPKLKISTRDKSYNLIDSPLYKLKNKKRLAQLLNINLCDFRTLTSDDENYSVFEQLSKKEKCEKYKSQFTNWMWCTRGSLVLYAAFRLHCICILEKNMFQY